MPVIKPKGRVVGSPMAPPAKAAISHRLVSDWQHKASGKAETQHPQGQDVLIASGEA